MYKITGLLAIIGILLVYIVLHLMNIPDGHSARVTIATTLGGMVFLFMTSAVILSTRLSVLENGFGGLDRMYQVHRYVGIATMVFGLVHWLSAPEELPAGADLVLNSTKPSAPLGILTMILLVVAVAMALNRKFPYSKWRPMHRFMPLIYLLAIGHFMTMPPAFVTRASPDMIYIMVFAIIGVASAIYSLFFMKKRNVYDYVVDAVEPMERATGVSLSPKGAKMPHKAGQFAFLTFTGKEWDETHPFTISSAPEDDHLKFTMKVLGDWTRKVRSDLAVGQAVRVQGPFGRFDTTIGKYKQVWIAGGIGITPFLSSLRDMKDDDPRHITLYYAVRSKDEALYLDEIQKTAKALGNVTIVTLFSDDGDFVTIERLAADLQEPLKDYGYYLCGPGPMIDGLKKALKGKGIERADIHTEAFEFR